MERDTRHAWQLIGKYNRIKNKLLEIKGVTDDLCVMCGCTDCDHPYPKLSQPQVFEVLTYFAEAFLNHTQSVWYDFERGIIKWPEGGSYNYSVEYTQSPRLDLPFAWIHKDNIGILSYVEGKSNAELTEFAENYHVGHGTFFGYWDGSKFYLLRAFRNGEWTGLQRFVQIPTADDIKIEDGFNVTGFWYIPQTSDPFEFATSLMVV